MSRKDIRKELRTVYTRMSAAAMRRDASAVAKYAKREERLVELEAQLIADRKRPGIKR